MDFKSEIQKIIGYLKKEDYTAAARHCTPAIEQALKQALKQHLQELKPDDQDKVREAVRKRDRTGKGIDNLTMGDLVYVFFRESKFLDAWERVSGKDLSGVRWFALDEIKKFRNEISHELPKVDRGKAKLLFDYLRAILEGFDLVSSEEIGQLVSSGTEPVKKVSQPVKAPDTLRLSPEDSKQLRQIVETLVAPLAYHERRPWVQEALEGKPKAKSICSNLHLDGAPESAAREIISHLTEFKRFDDGTHALGVFLSFIKDRIGDEQARFIDDVVKKYSLTTVVSPEPPSIVWQGDRPEDEKANETLREIIIGENTLLHVYVLELALKAAKAVVHVDVLKDGQQAFGTGFMISDELLMTNYHVISSLQEAQETVCSFNFQLGIGDKRLVPVSVRPKPDQGFHTNPELDYTILRLEHAPGREFGYLCLEPVTMSKGERVAIIQHPGGSFKQISIQNNFVAYANERIVQYTTSTKPGSSGSPVLNNEFKVIAIHHSGGKLEDPETKQYAHRNEGTSSCAILKDLQQHKPTLYDEVRKASLNES